MPLELAKETMVWREEAGRQASQILLEGDVIVPDSKPDLQELLRCEGPKLYMGYGGGRICIKRSSYLE